LAVYILLFFSFLDIKPHRTIKYSCSKFALCDMINYIN